MTYICKTCGNNFDTYWNIRGLIPCPACKSRNTIRYEMPKAKTKEEEKEPMHDDIDRSICYRLKRIIVKALADEGTFNMKEIQLDDPGFTMVAIADGAYPESKLPVTIQIEYGNRLILQRQQRHRKDHEI